MTTARRTRAALPGATPGGRLARLARVHEGPLPRLHGGAPESTGVIRHGGRAVQSPRRRLGYGSHAAESPALARAGSARVKPAAGAGAPRNRGAGRRICQVDQGGADDRSWYHGERDTTRLPAEGWPIRSPDDPDDDRRHGTRRTAADRPRNRRCCWNQPGQRRTTCEGVGDGGPRDCDPRATRNGHADRRRATDGIEDCKRDIYGVESGHLNTMALGGVASAQGRDSAEVSR